MGASASRSSGSSELCAQPSKKGWAPRLPGGMALTAASLPALIPMSKRHEGNEGELEEHIVLDLPGITTYHGKRSHVIPRSISQFSLNEKVIMEAQHLRRRWQEITIFVLPLLFSCIPMAVLLVGGVDSFEEFHPTEYFVPLCCFIFITGYHAYLIFFSRKGALTFFSRIRCAWAKMAFGKGNIEYINTLRDYMKVTTFLGSQAMLVASLLSTMAYKRLNKCANKTLLECDPRVLFSIAQLLALITHHFFVFVNLLQATRFCMHASFMLNTTHLNDRPIRSDAIIIVLSRANLFYALGLRQFYFDLPLFAWLLGPWPLLAVTVVYILLVHYIESVDVFIQQLHDRNQESKEKEDKEAAALSPDVGGHVALSRAAVESMEDDVIAPQVIEAGGGGSGSWRVNERPASDSAALSDGSGRLATQRALSRTRTGSGNSGRQYVKVLTSPSKTPPGDKQL